MSPSKPKHAQAEATRDHLDRKRRRNIHWGLKNTYIVPSGLMLTRGESVRLTGPVLHQGQIDPIIARMCHFKPNMDHRPP